MLLNGEDVTGRLRTPENSKGSSDIAVHLPVREKLVELQQRFAKANSVVMDGRDIGTVVMPDAQYKFFVTASARVRAQRRIDEMLQKNEIAPALEEMEQSILARDHTDSSRSCAPLKQAEDAILLDTTDMSIEQSVNAVLSVIRAGQA
jgi:cytidylate kinase